MSIKLKRTGPRVVIDIDGPDGNAHVLLGYASHMLKGDSDLREKVLEEMTSGDYGNLLLTFDKYLGDRFDLVTDNKELLSSLQQPTRA